MSANGATRGRGRACPLLAASSTGAGSARASDKPGPGVVRSADRRRPEGARRSAASARSSRPAACRTSPSIRRTRTPGTSPSAFGGLWKTTNRGTTFTPIFDDGGSFNLCCVVIDPKNSNILWLGTGENKSQRSAHFGDGIYKSTDAGKTWKRVGPREVRAHRPDPDRSAQLQRRLRRRAGAAVFGRRRARALQDDRRRHEVGPRAARQRRHRHQRRRVRPAERRRHLRVDLPAPAARRPDDRRRARKAGSASRPTPGRSGRS